jgi:hypothetical protein
LSSGVGECYRHRKRRLAYARTWPDPADAKPGEANTTLQIIKDKIIKDKIIKDKIIKDKIIKDKIIKDKIFKDKNL